MGYQNASKFSQGVPTAHRSYPREYNSFSSCGSEGTKEVGKRLAKIVCNVRKGHVAKNHIKFGALFPRFT